MSHWIYIEIHYFVSRGFQKTESMANECQLREIYDSDDDEIQVARGQHGSLRAKASQR